MKNYPVKENLIGSTVSEILRYKHTNKNPVTLVQGLSCYCLATNELAYSVFTRQSCKDKGLRIKD